MRRTTLFLLLSVSLVGTLYSIELDRPYPPTWEVSPDQIIELYGPPEFAVGSLLLYSASFADVTADVSCWITNGLLDRITMAFRTGNTAIPALRAEFTRVGKRLRVVYGWPDIIARSRYDYETHIWELPDGELRHSIIYTPGRVEHTLESSRLPLNNR